LPSLSTGGAAARRTARTSRTSSCRRPRLLSLPRASPSRRLHLDHSRMNNPCTRTSRKWQLQRVRLQPPTRRACTQPQRRPQMGSLIPRALCRSHIRTAAACAHRLTAPSPRMAQLLQRYRPTAPARSCFTTRASPQLVQLACKDMAPHQASRQRPLCQAVDPLFSVLRASLVKVRV
jgi:hypothetical protein